MTAYRLLFDHGLRRIDAERAHEHAFRAVRAARPALTGLDRLGRRLGDRWGLLGPGRPVEAMGIRFPNALGLAAGFDKSARGVDALAGLGFGHIEVGTVTALPQPGNPQPRLFRLPADRAVVNRMGFNNDGAEAVATRLAQRASRSRGPGRRPVLGINIGKSKVVPDDDQAAVEEDYRTSARLLAPYADYLVVNVSSPNTPGLRNLQAVERLGPLLETVRSAADEATPQGVPLLVKIAPDLADEDLLATADLAVDLGLEGMIATNTTISRDGLASSADEIERAGAGGLSGRPLAARACEVMDFLRRRVGPQLTLIGVGGISTPADARERLDAGATLLQAYTAFIYEGPLWPRRLVNSLEDHS